MSFLVCVTIDTGAGYEMSEEVGRYYNDRLVYRAMALPEGDTLHDLRGRTGESLIPLFQGALAELSSSRCLEWMAEIEAAGGDGLKSVKDAVAQLSAFLVACRRHPKASLSVI